MEVWKKTEFEGYEVSNAGSVRSNKKGRWIILKPMVTITGYLFVNIYNEPRKYKSVKIHRLVATAFLENPFNLPCVDHIDTNRQNNNASNLRWCTQKQNCRNPLSIERQKEAKKEQNKPVRQTDLNGSKINDYDGIKDASRKTGIPVSSISQVCNGILKQTHGFIFSFF